MVLTKQELIGALQHEVNILLHLAGKLDKNSLDYKPTANQRSSRELLQYMSMMGPALVEAAVQGGKFDPAAWAAAETAVKSQSLDDTLAAIRAQSETYAKAIGALSDADFRREITMFGRTQSTGAFLVTNVLSAYAAYRTQLFVYLKACGRTELNTMNLWAGMDAPMATA